MSPVEAANAIPTKTAISGTNATGPIRPTATSPMAEINVVASTIMRERAGPVRGSRQRSIAGAHRNFSAQGSTAR